MKKILTTALAIVLFVGASQAQSTEDSSRHHRGQRKEMGFDGLNLTADQKEKFKSIREAQKAEMESLKKNGSVTPEQRQALHQKYKAQYEAILTPAQQEQMTKKKEEWKEKGGEGKRKGEFGKQAAFYSKELNLTADQESKLKNIFSEFRTKSQEIRSNTSLSKEQKREQMKSLSQQYMAQGKAVLTSEQAQKFEQLKGKRHNKRTNNV